MNFCLFSNCLHLKLKCHSKCQSFWLLFLCALSMTCQLLASSSSFPLVLFTRTVLIWNVCQNVWMFLFQFDLISTNFFCGKLSFNSFIELISNLLENWNWEKKDALVKIKLLEKNSKTECIPYDVLMRSSL